MEVGIAILSLLWVIGILNLQRIDLLISDFTRALAYYLSVSQFGPTRGKIDLEQLGLLTSMGKDELILLINFDISETQRPDKEGLQKAAHFYQVTESLKLGYELLLILLTLLIPCIYLIDFSKTPHAQCFNKDTTLLIFLAAFVIASFAIEKMASSISKKAYPIRFEAQNH